MATPLSFGEFQIRPFDITKDLQAARQIWRECGWFENDDDDIYLEDFYAHGNGHVAALDDQAECIAHCIPGTIQHQHVPLKMASISSVVTGAIARRRGLAKVVTAQTLATAATEGYDVAVLGMFEQGFYDQLGFGSGTYEQVIALDPSDLISSSTHRIPRRLNKSDWRHVYSALRNRWLNHGACVLDAPKLSRARLAWYAGGLGIRIFQRPE